MGKVVITIGRQFGSGGHKIGEYLSNRLGLSYYDNELILLAAQRGDLKIEHVEEMDEMIQNPFLFEQQETVVEDSMEETIFQLQQEVIRQIAEKEDAVFVGRCADEALRKAGHRVLSIFISAPLPQRIARTCRLQGISKEECETLTERKDSTPAANGVYLKITISTTTPPKMILPISSWISSKNISRCALNKKPGP